MSSEQYAVSNYAQGFRDLILYQKATQVAQTIFDLSRSFPPEEKYSLTSQIRRSSRSVGAQIAEAWGKRRYEKHFVSKLTDADAERLETEHWVYTAKTTKYVSRANATQLLQDLEEIGKMLRSMMDKSSSFCREPDLDYDRGHDDDEFFS